MANKRRPARQWGGTFLGIVLGLIVGLAVAVVVAIYITKAPTPFVEKTPPRPQDNTPAAQSPDPNKALQSKSPLPNAPGTPAAASAVNPAAPPVTAANPVNPPATATANPMVPAAPAQNAHEAAAQGTPPAKPSPADILNGRADTTKLAAIPQVKTPTVPAPAAASDDSKTGYYLQVGAYKSAGDAEQQRANLALQGLEAKVTQRDANGLTLYRVRLGPYAKFDDMNRARQRLADAGVETAVIRFTKQ